MAKNEDKRLQDLERDTGPGDEVKVNVNWRTDDLIEDDDGTLITVEEYKRRHPDRKLKIVTWDDVFDDDDLPEQVPAA